MKNNLILLTAVLLTSQSSARGENPPAGKTPVGKTPVTKEAPKPLAEKPPVAAPVLPAKPAADAATSPNSSQSKDLAAIHETADTFTKAYNAGDAKVIAELFTADAEYVDGSGTVFHGKQAIQAEYEAYFKASPGDQIVIHIRNVRVVAPGVLVEDGTALNIPADKGATTKSEYVVVHVKQDGKWLIASARDEEAEPLSVHEQLKQLEWLVGEWLDEEDGVSVDTIWKWSEDGNYLVADVDMKQKGSVTMKATRRIGWDASKKQFRSWFFDSAGGVIDGLWSRNPDGWLVKLEIVLPDGTRGSSTSVYKRTGKDSFEWTSKDRIMGDKVSPDKKITVVRKPPAPATAPATKK